MTKWSINADTEEHNHIYVYTHTLSGVQKMQPDGEDSRYSFLKTRTFTLLNYPGQSQ